MATAMTRRRWVGDDDEIFDDEVFDRRYFPKLVYKDGYGPHVQFDVDGRDAPRADLAQTRTAGSALRRPGRCSGARPGRKESARLRDAWRGSPMAPDDDDVFDLATKIAPMLGLRRPIGARPDG